MLKIKKQVSDLVTIQGYVEELMRFLVDFFDMHFIIQIQQGIYIVRFFYILRAFLVQCF